ncbi:MAG: myo-inosose-2 dehydratase [Cyanobacteria bacterium J06635_10]
MLKQIRRLLISVVILMLFSISTPLSAKAVTIDPRYRGLPLELCRVTDAIDPTFESDNVYLGITPTGWSNSDDTSIDLVPPIPYQQILSEMQLADFKGSQVSPKYPEIDILHDELALRDLKISEPWVGTKFTTEKGEVSKEIFHEQMDYMKSLGDRASNVIVVAELGGAVHQLPVEPLKNRPTFSDEQWNKLTKGLNEIGKEAYEGGMTLVYHPHVGTGVETAEDIDRLMENTNPKYVKLLLDTGHLYYAGADPLKVTEKYAYRIGHVHLKNIRKDKLDYSKQNKLSFINSIKEGVFTVPGDCTGVIDFEPIFQTLADLKYEGESKAYKGWLVVEAEQDPNKAEPLLYAQIARNYLRQVTGL